MGLEFAVNKELATISATLAELTSIAEVVKSHISGGEFIEQFCELLTTISCGYEVILDNFKPWLAVSSQADFEAQFDGLHEHYKATFLKEAGKSRPSVERAYEHYQQLRTYKDFNTNFPLLKRTYNRLDDYIDKWIDNDTWLMMSLDRLFKMLSRLLQDISEFKRKDTEEAYGMFAQAFADFQLYVDIIQYKFVRFMQ